MLPRDVVAESTRTLGEDRGCKCTELALRCFVQHELHRRLCSVMSYACGSGSWQREERQQQNTELCNELDNTTRLLDLRPESIKLHER